MLNPSAAAATGTAGSSATSARSAAAMRRTATRADLGVRGSGTRAPRPRAGGRSEHRRADRWKSCTTCPPGITACPEALLGWPSDRAYRTMQAPRDRSRRPASTTVEAIAAAPGSRDPEELVPEIRPFRALRYDPEVAGDPSALVAPPYDVIGPELHRELLARHPRNVVRLDLPQVVPGEDPDERYRRVARTLAAWRQDGTLRKDPRPSVYVYEQAYRVPGTTVERTQRGFFARLLHRAVRAGKRRAATREDAVGTEGGPLPAPAGRGHQHLAGGGALRGPGPDGRARPGGGDRRDARPWTSRTTTACAIACGPCPTTGRAARPRACARSRARVPCSSRTATTATRPPSATGTSGARTTPASRTPPTTSC